MPSKPLPNGLDIHGYLDPWIILPSLDPLSPLLYVLGSELLQVVVNDHFHQGGIDLPIFINDEDYPIIQYAEDTLLIMPADLDQVIAMKDLLHKFSLSTGFKVNYHKLSMIPVNVPGVYLDSWRLLLGVRLVVCLLLIWDYH